MMNNADVIQIGDLVPNSNTMMVVNLEAAAGTAITTKIAGCVLDPAVFLHDGEQRLTIGLRADRLNPGDILMGELVLKEANGQRSMWLIGQILDTAPGAMTGGMLCLRFGKVRFFCAHSLELSATRFKAFLSDADARFASGRLVMMRSNPASGSHFTLTATTPPPPNTLLNQVPVSRWSRRLLQSGQRLSINGLDFQIEEAAKPPLSVDKEVLDFGILQHAGQSLELKIHNPDMMFAAVKVVTTVPWLEVSTPDVNIGGGQTATLPVRLNAQALQLKRGRYEEHSAIWLVAKEAVLAINVSLKVEELPVIPAIQPAIIRLGDALIGQVAGLQANFEVSNEGGSAWAAQIVTGVSWLTTEPAGTFIVPPHGKQSIKLLTTPAANTLPVGVPPNLEIKAEGSGASASARVILNVKPQPIQLSIQPDMLAFGDYQRRQHVPPKTLVFENTGKTPFEGQLKVNVPWLAVQQTNLKLAAGEKITLDVCLHDSIDSQPDGVLNVAQALIIVSGNASNPVAARVNILPALPRLTTRTTLLRFPDYQPGTPLPSSSLELVNEGEGAWEGLIHARVPWLKVTPDKARLASGEKLTLKIEVTPAVTQEKNPMLSTTRAVQVVGKGQTITIGAWLNVIDAAAAPPAPSPAPEPLPLPPVSEPISATPASSSILLGVVIKPQTLILGDGTQPAAAVPPVILRISTALQKWRCVVRSTSDFLDVSPAAPVTIRGGQPAHEVKIGLRPGANIPSGVQTLPEGIVIEGDNGLVFSASVQIHLA